MPVTARDLSMTPPSPEFHGLLVGPEGAGKSRLAATGRLPILFIDTDRRADSLAGLKDVYSLTYRDVAWPNQPTGFSEILDLMTMLESSRQLNKLHAVFMDKPESVKVRTLVFDSLYTLSNLARSYALYSNEELRRKVNIGGKFEVQIPKSWDGWQAEVAMVEALLLRALAVPGLDVILISHETDEERPESTDKNPSFTGAKCIYPVRYRVILKYFNDLWRVTRLNSKVPSVTILPDNTLGVQKCSLDIEKVELDGASKSPSIRESIKIARLKAGLTPEETSSVETSTKQLPSYLGVSPSR